MINKKELTIEEIEEKIKELKENLSEQEQEYEDLKYRLDIIEIDIDSLNEDLDYYNNKKNQILYKNIPEKLLLDESKPQLNGQFICNNKWCICNGYLLLENNKKFDTLEVVEGMDVSIDKILKEKLKCFSIIDYSQGIIIDEMEERDDDKKISCYDCYLFNKEYAFQKNYVDIVLKVIGRDSIKKVIIYDDNRRLGVSGTLYIEGEDMRAIILGIVYEPKEEE